MIELLCGIPGQLLTEPFLPAAQEGHMLVKPPVSWSRAMFWATFSMLMGPDRLLGKAAGKNGSRPLRPLPIFRKGAFSREQAVQMGEDVV